jgi:Cu/Ag efflux pump CusA
VLAAAAPVALIPGLTGTFLRPMVLAFMLCVAASTVVALTVTPALAALLLGGGRREPNGRPSLASRAYQATLRGVLRVPRLLAAAVCVAGVTLAGAAAVAALPSIHPSQPQFQDRNLVIRWTGAPGMSLPELDRLAARTSQQLTALPAVADVAATVGRAVSSDQIVSTNSAEIWVTIKPGAPYDRAVSQVRAIAGGMPGVAGTVGTYESDSMGGVLAAAPGALTVRLYGSDYGVLARLGRQVEAVMARISGLGPARMQPPASQPTLNVAVDLTAATRNGVKPGDIRREAATLLSGLTVGNFFEQQKVFDVVVQGTAAVRASPASVRGLLLDTVNGGHARLGALARVSVAAEPLDITHDAMSPYLDVTARLSGRGLGSARAAVTAGLRGISFPLSYYAAVQYPSPGAPAGQAMPGWRLAGYVIAALIGVLLLAQSATGSWRLALLVLASLPVPVAVGLLTAYRLGTQDSLAALAGLLGVLAVAIHQAFRVTAAIRRAHLADGGPLTLGLTAAGAAEAAGPAFTAALMSAAALVPFVAVGQVAGNELPHAAAPVILAGLGAATLLNTLVLPAACLWFGPARAPQNLPAPPDVPPDVPQPREEPGVPSAAVRPENPVS